MLSLPSIPDLLRHMPRLARLLVVALTLLCGALSASADPVGISSAPLLNVSGSSTVKPNLMLLYDNSGSMNFNYTPDYVGNPETCRAQSTMARGQRACVIGDPPFASADFNRQYYDPKVRYLPPVRANGTSYASMTRANTNGWVAVANDAYGINQDELLLKDANGRNRTMGTQLNLTREFPDIAWCANNDCSINSVGYTYPTNSRYNVSFIEGAPYYYSINVAEYCTDNTLTKCQQTAVNAGPQPGYPVPAKVRFCDTADLTNCQGKFVGNYKYPRFSGENLNTPWWGTITIGATAGSTRVVINSVTAVGLSDAVITKTAVVGANGTNSEDKRSIMASALAASIVAQTGLANDFTACVTTPRHVGVPSCASFGITLGGTNLVGVIPVQCGEGASKAANNCTPVNDNSRAGDNFMVSSGTGSTALLTISGTSASNGQDLKSLKFGTKELLTSTVALGKSASASTVVANLVRAIGTRATVTAYVGGSAASPLCAAQSTSTLCLIDTAANAGGSDLSWSEPTNNSSGNSTRLRLTGYEAVYDGLQTASSALGASIFVRTSIVPSRTIYPRDAARLDCAGPVCTYDEEMTNFANWYTYYKTRNQMMKTAVGHAFDNVTDKYNVGVVALSVAAANGAINRPLPFAAEQRQRWYDALYDMRTGGATPVRDALHSVGLMYANRAPYVAPAGEEAVKFACQQNFTFVTTDGYWNGDPPDGVNNNDNVENPARFCTRAAGCVDPRAQSKPSLADIALYWYNGGSNGTGGSLRTTLEDWTKPGQVPAGAGENTRLHMKTYALGLGVDGIMNYEPNYDTAAAQDGDFYKVLNGVRSGCPWNNNGAWVWPDPSAQLNSGSLALQSRVDDLWHAAINGHGKYFSASDPGQVIEGFRTALSKIDVQTGGAASAATSTPNVTAQDNDVFMSTFRTVVWTGRLTKRSIDPVSGEIGKTELWNTSSLLGTMVDASSDERNILMLDPQQKILEPFTFANLSDADKLWFSNKCSVLAQCTNMLEANRRIANSGETIVNWLRGQQQYANDVVLRKYATADPVDAGASATLPVVLGDIASSSPAYLREPRKNFDRDGYAAYRAANSARAPTVFVGANDGMLHAFNAANGGERFAYVPRITMKKLHLQASTNYNLEHQYTVDGSPEVADVYYDGSWKSVLVGGLNSGGRGYYALDVTDPANPRAMWELCADSAVCSGDNLEPELGLTFGNPQFGTIMVNGQETWVVFLTSGYNNIPGTDKVSGGTGKGWLFVVNVKTGKVLHRISTGAGDTTTPSGLARITAITADPRNDPRVTYVYGGDNLGKMWRFDFTGSGAPTVLLMGDAGASQPITTRPEVTTCRADRIVDGIEVLGITRVVVFGTGRLLDRLDVANEDLQSIYVLKDTGTAISGGDWRKSPEMVRKTLAMQDADDPNSKFVMTGMTVDFATQKGWYVDLSLHKRERVNLDPKVFSGTLALVTNVPSSTTDCSVGGNSKLYQFNVCEALNGVVGEPLANNAAVGFEVVQLPDGPSGIIPDSQGGDKEKKLTPSITSGAKRTGWRRVRD